MPGVFGYGPVAFQFKVRIPTVDCMLLKIYMRLHFMDVVCCTMNSRVLAASSPNGINARIQKVLSEGSNSDSFFFLDDEGREDPNSTKNCPFLIAGLVDL